MGRRGGSRTAHTASTAGIATRRTSTRSTPRRRRCPDRCTWATCSPTPTPTPSPATGGCAATASSTRWDGTTTAYPPNAGPAVLRRPLRPGLRPDPDFAVPASAGQGDSCRRCRVPTSWPCATSSPPRTSRPSRRSGGGSGCRSTGRLLYTTISDRARRVSQRGFLRLLAGGHAYSQEAPPCGTSTSRLRSSQAELEDREIAGAYHRICLPAGSTGQGAMRRDRHDPARAPPRLRRAGVPPRRRPLRAARSARNVRTPLVRRSRCPSSRHPLADPEKGTGIAMICTFGDTTDVIWWRELGCPPARSSAATAGCTRRPWGTRMGVATTPRRPRAPTPSSKAARSHKARRLHRGDARRVRAT